MTGSELAGLRLQVEATLPDSATVQRLNPQTYQWFTVGERPCRLVPRRTTMRPSGGEPEGVTLWQVLLPWNADVQIGDRLLIATGTYVVTGSDRQRSEALALIVQCNRLA